MRTNLRAIRNLNAIRSQVAEEISELSLREAAKKLEVSVNTVRRFLNGQPLQRDTVIRICKTLGLKWEIGGNE